MKKLLCILMMLLLAFPALAEESSNPFAPFVLPIPDGVTLEENEGTHAFVSGNTRVVAMVISRVPDDDPVQAIHRLMNQFEPNAGPGEALSAAEGYAALSACTAAKFGEDVNQWNVMLLSPTGDLLILSGYDLDGDDDSVHALLEMLLAAITVDGMPILSLD